MGSLTVTEPCRDRIIIDAGTAFGVGAVGGSFFHFAKGLRNAPNGARFTGGLRAMRMNVPSVAGSFAVWGCLYSACGCALVYKRQEEDPWNSIISGAATGGILSLRQVFRVAVRSSMQGARLLASINGVAIMLPFINGVGIIMQHTQPGTVSMPADVPAITRGDIFWWWVA